VTMMPVILKGPGHGQEIMSYSRKGLGHRCVIMPVILKRHGEWL
jgi:hypothetical protein